MAATGLGEQVTTTARFITKEGVSLGIWHTRGLEMEDFEETIDELTRLVARRAADPDPKHHIHVSWLCVHENARRVQNAEQNLCSTLHEHMPVLGARAADRSPWAPIALRTELPPPYNSSSPETSPPSTSPKPPSGPGWRYRPATGGYS